MIISGKSISNWRSLSQRLAQAPEGGCVRVIEIRGVASETVPEALHEMAAVASGTRCANFLYHVSINPRPDERPTTAQWEQAVDQLEENLGLEDQPRVVVEREQDGRVFRHVAWSRIRPDTMTAISDGFTFSIHERTSRELERLFGLTPVESAAWS